MDEWDNEPEDDEPEPTRPRAEGVRILGAEEAAAAVSSQEPTKPRHKSRCSSNGAAPIDGGATTRFPLDDNDPNLAPPTLASPAAPPNLPHWTEPPTGEVPAVLTGRFGETETTIDRRRRGRRSGCVVGVVGWSAALARSARRVGRRRLRRRVRAGGQRSAPRRARRDAAPVAVRRSTTTTTIPTRSPASASTIRRSRRSRCDRRPHRPRALARRARAHRASRVRPSRRESRRPAVTSSPRDLQAAVGLGVGLAVRRTGAVQTGSGMDDDPGHGRGGAGGGGAVRRAAPRRVPAGHARRSRRHARHHDHRVSQGRNRPAAGDGPRRGRNLRVVSDSRRERAAHCQRGRDD